MSCSLGRSEFSRRAEALSAKIRKPKRLFCSNTRSSYAGAMINNPDDPKEDCCISDTACSSCFYVVVVEL